MIHQYKLNQPMEVMLFITTRINGMQPNLVVGHHHSKIPSGISKISGKGSSLVGASNLPLNQINGASSKVLGINLNLNLLLQHGINLSQHLNLNQRGIPNNNSGSNLTQLPKGNGLINSRRIHGRNQAKLFKHLHQLLVRKTHQHRYHNQLLLLLLLHQSIQTNSLHLKLKGNQTTVQHGHYITNNKVSITSSMPCNNLLLPAQVLLRPRLVQEHLFKVKHL